MKCFDDGQNKHTIEAANYSVAFFHGHKQQGVIATAKHFPGHGNCKGDSHSRLPEIQSNLNFLYHHDLIPYQFLIKEGIPAIMVAHISFPKITHSHEPATLSQLLITGLLRDKLNYDGIVITDDLNMAGMHKKGVKVGDKSLEAIKAGNDLVLISRKKSAKRQYEQQWDSVFQEIQNNPAFKQSVKASAIRIIRTKLTYLTGEHKVPFYPDEKTILEKIPSEEAKKFFFSQACRSVTQVSTKALTLNANDQIILAGYYRDFFSEGKKRYPTALSYNTFSRLKNSGIRATVNDLKKRTSSQTRIIIAVSDEQTLSLANSLKSKGVTVLALSTYMPGYAENLKTMDYALAIYGINRYSYQAAFAVFSGDYKPSGKIPF